MKQRVPAFTIMELTIAMLLSALVIAITYTAYSLISKYYADYHQKHEEMAVIIRLDELLKRDFSKAEGVYYTPEGYLFKDSIETIQYSFSPEYVLRSSTITDTFKVTLSQVKASFEEQPVNEETIIPDSLESSRVDALSFQLLYKQETFPYYYHKQYSAQNLINRKTHALH